MTEAMLRGVRCSSCGEPTGNSYRDGSEPPIERCENCTDLPHVRSTDEIEYEVREEQTVEERLAQRHHGVGACPDCNSVEIRLQADLVLPDDIEELLTGRQVQGESWDLTDEGEDEDGTIWMPCLYDAGESCIYLEQQSPRVVCVECNRDRSDEVPHEIDG